MVSGNRRRQNSGVNAAVVLINKVIEMDHYPLPTAEDIDSVRFKRGVPTIKG